MVEVRNFNQNNFILELQKRAPDKLLKYIHNNIENKRLYFYYGDDSKRFILSNPDVYIIRKQDMDKTKTALLLDIFEYLLPFIRENINIFIYTSEKIKPPRGIAILPLGMLTPRRKMF